MNERVQECGCRWERWDPPKEVGGFFVGGDVLVPCEAHQDAARQPSIRQEDLSPTFDAYVLRRMDEELEAGIRKGWKR